jgi:hypothetical protein
MAFVNGDVKEISIEHPTLGNFFYKVKKDDEWTIKVGGRMTTDDDTGITGDGIPIWNIQNNLWSIEGNVVWDKIVRDELTELTDLSGDVADGQITIAFLDGSIWGGKGRPVGETSGTNKGDIAAKMAGGGRLVKLN